MNQKIKEFATWLLPSIFIFLIGKLLGSHYYKLGYGPGSVGCPEFNWCQYANYRLLSDLLPWAGIIIALLWLLFSPGIKVLIDKRKK